MLAWFHPLALMVSKGEVKRGEVCRFPPLEIKTKGRISGLSDNILVRSYKLGAAAIESFNLSLTLLAKNPFLFIVFCARSVLPMCIYVYHMCLWPGSLGPELQTVTSSFVGARNQTQVLYNNKCS